MCGMAASIDVDQRMPTPLTLVAAFLVLVVPIDLVQATVMTSRHDERAGAFWLALALFLPLYLAAAYGLRRARRWAWILALIVSALAALGGAGTLATGRVAGLFNAVVGPVLLALLLQRSSRQWVGA